MDANIRAKWGGIWRLTRMDKPIGIYLLLWPTLWGLWFAAGGFPPWPILLVFVLGTVLMRAAGCAINDFADRDFDGQVERTRERPLASGELMPRDALIVFVTLSLIAFGLVLTLNPLAIALSVPAVLLAASYPFAKRYTYLPQAHLGAAFGWSVPMAFAAVQSQVPPLAWLLFLITLLWAVGYDTYYAMVDRQDDLKAGIKSSAILFGRLDRLITAVLYVLVVSGLAVAGLWTDRGLWYGAGLLVASGYAIYQQVLIRHREPEACFRAFIASHRFGMAVFGGLLLDSF